MTTPELIKWLRDNSAGVYRPAAEAADRLERLYRQMEAFTHCDLNKSNCASLEVASQRIRTMSKLALM